MIRRIDALVDRLYVALMAHLRPVALVGGSIAVTIWTLIRHFGNGVNYDIIGQLSLSDQWAHGLTDGAQLGSTNYLLKMPIYFLMNGLEFLSPRSRLLILVIIFNLLTFLLLVKLMEKLLDLYKVSDKSWLYIGALWLATISGRVFWLDYPNSRNLETVGGILFLYLLLRYIHCGRRQVAFMTVLAGGIVFFADPLQLFMIGVPAGFYFAARWLISRSKINLRQALAVGSIVLSALVFSKILFVLSRAFLPVTYLDVPSMVPSITVSHALVSLKNIIVSTGTIFDSNFISGAHNLNSVRRVLNFAVLMGIVSLIYRIISRPQKPLQPLTLLTFMIAAMYVVYIVSGQALQNDTSRYLIMLPLVTLSIVALGANHYFAKHMSKIQKLWLAIIIINSCLLVGALYINFPNRYAKEVFTSQIQTFMDHNKFDYAIAARSLAMPTNYYADRRLFILPVFCTPNHQVKQTNLFFDKAAFDKLKGYDGEVPIILQGSVIDQGSRCSEQEILRQFGMPVRQLTVLGVGEVLVYRATNLWLGE